MKCYELKNDILLKGLLITDESGPPRIRTTSGGDFTFPLDPGLGRGYAEAPKLAPIVQEYASLSKDMKRLTFPKRNDHLALVLLSIEVGLGGDISISGCAFDESVSDYGRVEKLYRPFPSQGVKVLGEHPEPGPWFGGASKLELLLVMIQGAQIRITRTGPLFGARPITTLYWNGYELMDGPRRREQRPQQQDNRTFGNYSQENVLESHSRENVMETYEEQPEPELQMTA